MTEEGQRTLEGLPLDLLRKELEGAVERVLQRYGILDLAKQESRHDRAYKGDTFWIEYRIHVVQLVKRNLAVSYRDLDQDRYFTKVRKVRTLKQWHRDVDQHLIPNEPRGEDRYEFAAFTLASGDRGTRYVTFRSWAHCAIAKVAGSRRGVARATQEKYDATGPCERCAPTAQGPDDDGTTVTQLVSHGGVTKPVGEGLTPEEAAVLHATKSRGVVRP